MRAAAPCETDQLFQRFRLGIFEQRRTDSSYRFFAIESSLSNTETHRVDIEFPFEAVEQFIVDCAVISQSNQS